MNELDEIREILYEPTKRIIELMERQRDSLSLEQIASLERLKTSIRIYEISNMKGRF